MTTQPLALFNPDDYSDGWRICPRCVSFGFDGRYPEAFFRRLYGRSLGSRDLGFPRSRICLGCEDELDEDRALRESLARRIVDHAKRHGTPIKTYRTRYNLGSSTVLDWWKAKIRSGVLDCGCLVSEMRHGTKDIELHQLKPREPFFPETWQLVCTNDHRGMQHPDYPAVKRGWKLWKQSRE